MSTIDCAVSAFKGGMNCAQAVLATFGSRLGLSEEKSRAVAFAFGGGMGRTGCTCGAVTGALMVVGLHCAVVIDKKDREGQAYDMARHFLERFEAENGAVDCRDLLGVDISTPDGSQKISKGLFKTRCSEIVQSAASLLVDLMEENTDDRAC